MESTSTKDLLYNFSLLSNVLPYLGYLDQVYFFMTNCCKKTNELLQTYDEFIVDRSLANHIRVHPFFDGKSKYTIKQIERVYDGIKYKIFRLPNITMNHNTTDLSEFDDFFNSEWAQNMKFSKIDFGSINNFENYITLVEKFKQIPYVEKNFTDLIEAKSSNWQNGVPATAIPYLDFVEFYAYNVEYSLEDQINMFNTIEFPVKHICQGFTYDETIPQYEINEVISNSVEEFTVRFNNNQTQFGEGYKAYSKFLLNCFPKLKKINYSLHNNSMKQLWDVVKDSSKEDIEEFQTQNIYPGTQVLNGEVVAKDCILYFKQSTDKPTPVAIDNIRFQIASIKGHTDVKNVDYLEFNVTGQIFVSGLKQSNESELLIESDNSNVNNNTVMLFIPSEAVTNLRITLNPSNNTDVISNLPDTLVGVSKNTKLDIKISNTTADTSVEKILPRLAEFWIDTLSLDLNYTTEDMFDTICRYIELSKENRSINHLSLSIFSQKQFEQILNAADNSAFRSLNIVLYCEAMINLRNLIYEFRCRNPFTSVCIKYLIEREKTFTIKDLMKDLLKAGMMQEDS